MNFFVYQPEYLFSINTIFSPLIFKYSGDMVIGLLGIIVCLVILIWQKYRGRKFSSQHIIYVCTLLWLPLFFQFFYSNIIEIKNTIFMINKSTQEQMRWRSCAIDFNQQLGGGLCQVSKFVELVKKEIPKGSMIAFASGSVSLFPEYYLISDYNITTDYSKAQYILLYHPLENFNLAEDGRLSTIEVEEQGNKIIDKDFLGYFQVEAQLNPQMVIFKRLTP